MPQLFVVSILWRISCLCPLVCRKKKPESLSCNCQARQDLSSTRKRECRVTEGDVCTQIQLYLVIFALTTKEWGWGWHEDNSRIKASEDFSQHCRPTEFIMLSLVVFPLIFSFSIFSFGLQDQGIDPGWCWSCVTWLRSSTRPINDLLVTCASSRVHRDGIEIVHSYP